MSSVPEKRLIPYSQFEQLRQARAVILHEAAALQEIAGRLDTSFCRVLDLLHSCQGRVIVTGMGKAGLIGQKITASLASTGTRAHFLHPAEAVHGDLGCLHGDDVLLALSNSGETEEVCRLLPIVRRLAVPIVAITACDESTLGTAADVTVPLGRLREADEFGLAPSTSTTAMLALGDALAIVLSRLRGFTPQEFAIYHPGGSLGRRLTLVREVMRTGDQLRIAAEDVSIREALAVGRHAGRRTGAVMLVDCGGRLSGLFTDSDLVRLLEQRRESQLDRPIAEVMTARPLTISESATLAEAVALLSRRKFSELPVADEDGRPVGLIDITDVIGDGGESLSGFEVGVGRSADGRPLAVGND
jgi:arabinose-5-phosphate isomerase